MGQKMMPFVEDTKAADARTFTMAMKQPYALVVESLAKPSVVTPFMMPRRVAETDPFKQISEYVGSGPLILKKDQRKPGEKVVYVRNTRYKPRPEGGGGLAGAKVAKVDRVEWMNQSSTFLYAVNALQKGEIDIMEAGALRPAAAGRDQRSITL